MNGLAAAARLDLVINGTTPPTDVYYFGLYPDQNGNLVMTEVSTEIMTALATLGRTRNFRTHLVIGGWGQSMHFPSVAGSDVATATFVIQCINLLKTYDLHGVSLDWEFPSNDNEVLGYSKMIRALSLTMRPRVRPRACGGAQVRWRALCSRVRLLRRATACRWRWPAASRTSARGR